MRHLIFRVKFIENGTFNSRENSIIYIIKDIVCGVLKVPIYGNLINK